MEPERNHLNPHNIDPSRIDRAPGFDSIRPGQTSKRYGAPEITLTPEAERMRQERRTFAAQLRDLMELAGMDNDALAAATGIKVSKILSCRTSNAMPKVMDAIRMARALGVSVELLMTGEEV